MNEQTEPSNELICQDCGSNKDVRVTICPLAKEIYNKIKEVTVCENCYKERLWSI